MTSNLSKETEQTLLGPPPVFRTTIGLDEPSRFSNLMNLIASNAANTNPVYGAAYSMLDGLLKFKTEQSNHQFIYYLNEEIERLSTSIGILANVIRGPELSSIIFKCLAIAQRLDTEEKRILLRNALVNTIFRDDHEKDFRDSFFSLIEELTPTQISYLKLGSNPIPKENLTPFTYNNEVSDYDHLMINIHNWSEFRKQNSSLPDPDILKFWIQPLLDRGLLMKGIQGKVHTSKLGLRFLKFIITPEQSDICGSARS